MHLGQFTLNFPPWVDEGNEEGVFKKSGAVQILPSFSSLRLIILGLEDNPSLSYEKLKTFFFFLNFFIISTFSKWERAFLTP